MITKIKNSTFSDILREERERNTRLTSQIVEKLSTYGIEITPRTIQLYKSGNVVPEYQLAKLILISIGVYISETELIKLLERSKSQKGEINNGVWKTVDPNSIKPKSLVIRKRISLKPENFTFLDNSNISKDYSIDLIEEHVAEKYGTDQMAFNRYIRDLINDDMKPDEKK